MGKKQENKKKEKKRPELKEGELPNVEFYSQKRSSEPEGDFINVIHKEWFGERKLLEYHHGYIQWLFPTSEEPGLNNEAYQLSSKEIELFKSTPELQQNLLISFELMLDFFGMKMKDVKTGELERHEEWKERYKHLNKKANEHNFMRITRIIKCLCLTGLEMYATKFVEFLVEEIFIQKVFENKTAQGSCEKFFIPSIPKDKQGSLLEIVKNSKTKKKEKK